MDGGFVFDQSAAAVIGGVGSGIVGGGSDNEDQTGFFRGVFLAFEEKPEDGDFSEEGDLVSVFLGDFAIEAAYDQGVSIRDAGYGLDHGFGHVGILIAGHAYDVIGDLGGAKAEFTEDGGIRG